VVRHRTIDAILVVGVFRREYSTPIDSGE
jgi:hypothetical protein